MPEDKTSFLDTCIYHENFEDQLSYFSKHDASIIPLEGTVAYINGYLNLRNSSFLSPSTQDKLNSILYIRKYGYPATFFIRPDTVGETKNINGRYVNHMNQD